MINLLYSLKDDAGSMSQECLFAEDHIRSDYIVDNDHFSTHLRDTNISNSLTWILTNDVYSILSKEELSIWWDW